MFYSSLNENRPLYLRPYEYNVCLFCGAFARVAANNDNTVKPGRGGLIVDRNILNGTKELQDRIEHGKDHAWSKDPGKKAAYLARLQKELAELQAIDNTPRRIEYTGTVSFTTPDGYFVTLQTPDNPFDDWLYIKTPIKAGNKYSRDAVFEMIPGSFTPDFMFMSGAASADLVELANLAYNAITAAPVSPVRLDKERVRVPNVYSAGWHYETVYSPERFADIDS